MLNDGEEQVSAEVDIELSNVNRPPVWGDFPAEALINEGELYRSHRDGYFGVRNRRGCDTMYA